MKKRILLTGGGTGGHIYPLLSVGKRIKEIGRGDIEIRYIGPKSNWMSDFIKNDIKVHSITGAKMRRYFDIKNLLAVPKFLYSIIEAFFKIYFIMPDVVFSKGGPGSIAVTLAAKFYMIPIVIHESDSVPSLTTKVTAKFSKKIALSFENSKKYFPNKNIFLSGNPVRNTFLSRRTMNKSQAKNYLGFNENEPLILVMGGSQGSQRINSMILENIDKLINDFQIFHLVGKRNIQNTKGTVEIASKQWNEKQKNRYKYKDFLSEKEMGIVMNAADILISRSGSGTIFESAAMQLPAILVPLEEAANGHQKMNAYEYSKTGAAIVIEENNFSANIVLSRIKSILQSPQELKKMREAAGNFAKPDASNTIAKEVFKLL